MAVEDFTTYTEVDSDSSLTVIASRIDFDTLSRNEEAYVYKDFGIDYWEGDFEFLMDFEITSGVEGSVVIACLLSNLVDDAFGIYNASGDFLGIRLWPAGGGGIQLSEVDGGSFYADTFPTLDLNTRYYLRYKRNESIGLYGTLICLIYSDSARTVLLDTLSIALHSSKKDFRYKYGSNAWNTGETIALTGDISNLDLGLVNIFKKLGRGLNIGLGRGL